MSPPTKSPATTGGGAASFVRRLLRGPGRGLLNELTAGSVGAAVAALSVALWIVATGPVGRGVAIVLMVGALTQVVVRKHKQLFSRAPASLLGSYVSVRVLALVGLGIAYVLRRPDDRWWIGAALAVALVSVVVEPGLKAALVNRPQRILQLPGVSRMPEPRFAPGLLTTLSFLAIIGGGVLAAAAVPGWVYLLLTLLSAPVVAILIRQALGARLVSSKIKTQLTPALTRYKPEFAVYYATVAGAEYQLGMWLPYLERLGRPFVVITRFAETADTIARLTTAPVIVPRSADLGLSFEQILVPSMKAAFYVQGSSANQSFQRYRRLTHVWLNHGDSDKQANFHPRHATYDKLFVSGQLGIDRYATHGITVPPEKFVVVGRPQIEKIAVLDAPPAPDAPRTVLYAPTWRGGRPSTNYSSLAWGEQIVSALLQRGATVLFRPHPRTYDDPEDCGRARRIQALLESDRRSSGREHRWGTLTEKEWDIPACFNHADALITDVSSVASDFLVSGKPFAMVATKTSVTDFRSEFAMARVAYVWASDQPDLDAVLEDLCGADPMRDERAAYRTYCLGDRIGPTAAEPFLEAAGRIVAGQR